MFPYFGKQAKIYLDNLSKMYNLITFAFYKLKKPT